MENSKQTPGNKEMPQYPKPGDELQKHIETVIPDAEKETINSANASPEQAAERESGAAPKLEKSAPGDEDANKPLSQEGVTENSEADNPSAKDENEGTGASSESEDSENEEAENPLSEAAKEQSSGEKPKDAGDEVETVSP